MAERTTDEGLPAGLSQPALRALRQAGLVRLEDFSDIPEADLRKMHGVGPKAIEQLRHALTAKGLSFRD